MSIVLGWGLPFSVNTDVSRSFYGSLVVLSPGDMRTNQTLLVPVFMEHEFCCENVYDQVIEQRTEKSLNVIFNVNHHGSWLIAPQTQRRKQIKTEVQNMLSGEQKKSSMRHLRKDRMS